MIFLQILGSATSETYLFKYLAKVNKLYIIYKTMFYNKNYG